MNTITVLLVLFVLDGEVSTFAVQAESMEQCLLMVKKTPEVLPKMIGKKPDLFAASCAEVKAIVTEI